MEDRESPIFHSLSSILNITLSHFQQPAIESRQPVDISRSMKRSAAGTGVGMTPPSPMS